MHCSLAINLIYAGVNTVSGVLYKTHWFGIFAGYYGIIAIMRFLLIRYVGQNGIGTNPLGELKRARLCAVFSLLFLETAMFAQFGADTSSEVKRIMIMATGAGISIIVVVMAFYVIIRSSRALRQFSD